jgi:hypothetical protein
LLQNKLKVAARNFVCHLGTTDERSHWCNRPEKGGRKEEQHMLGEQISEASGSTTGVRVLSAEGDDSKMEVSFQGRGEVLGVGITDIGTFVQRTKPGGTLSGEDSNVLMLTDDGEMVAWKGFGVGRPTGPGFSSSWGVAAPPDFLHSQHPPIMRTPELSTTRGQS